MQCDIHKISFLIPFHLIDNDSVDQIDMATSGYLLFFVGTLLHLQTETKVDSCCLYAIMVTNSSHIMGSV